MKIRNPYSHNIDRTLDMGEGIHTYHFKISPVGSCFDKYGMWLREEYIIFKKDGIYKEYYTQGIGSWYTFQEKFLSKKWENEVKKLLKGGKK